MGLEGQGGAISIVFVNGLIKPCLRLLGQGILLLGVISSSGNPITESGLVLLNLLFQFKNFLSKGSLNLKESNGLRNNLGGSSLIRLIGEFTGDSLALLPNLGILLLLGSASGNLIQFRHLTSLFNVGDELIFLHLHQLLKSHLSSSHCSNLLIINVCRNRANSSNKANSPYRAANVYAARQHYKPIGNIIQCIIWYNKKNFISPIDTIGQNRKIILQEILYIKRETRGA